MIRKFVLSILAAHPPLSLGDISPSSGEVIPFPHSLTPNRLFALETPSALAAISHWAEGGMLPGKSLPREKRHTCETAA
ncbi:hypothetical protein GGD55_000077 [Rhizobium giardinii]|uniref:Uncharacterized protein n=1 Tax=Rhizobium giardinii TaxID=56731 RepID=A0A7W8U5X6_9HYPH|nr:hypothetical protein [Rhizobium giardinii]